MSRQPGSGGGAMYPCPRCQKLASRVQRRRWTRNRLIAPIVLGLLGVVAFSIITGAVAFGVLVGFLIAAIAFALAPITFVNLECESCGFEEEVSQ